MVFETGIPIPKKAARTNYKGRPSLAGVEGMEVGQSVLHPFLEWGDHTQYGRITASAVYYGRKHGTEYEVRKMDDGIRVWRVK